MHSRTANILCIILSILLFITELVAAGMMWVGHSPLGVVVHGLLGVAMLLIGLHAARQVNAMRMLSNHHLTLTNLYTLMFANLGLLEIISIHDCDHMRQAMGWGYHFTLALLLVNVIVYLPDLISLILVAQGKSSGIIATLVSGLLIGGAFLKLHLLGAWIPVWGPWNKSFFTLGVDQLSWWILAITAVAGVIVSLLAAYVLGRVQERGY